MTAISCISLVCPVGYTPASAAAAMRARIPAFEELMYLDRGGQPLRGARVEAIRPETRGRDRLHALARLAIEHIDGEVAALLPWGEMPFLLCTRDADMPGARINGILAGLMAPNGAPLAGRRSFHITNGQISAFVAVEQARRLLNERNVEACLIMAIDSLIDARSLSWLDNRMRLKTSQVTDGLIPGEAACILVASKRPIVSGSLRLRGLGLAIETATAGNEDPFRANGLSAALKAALAEAAVQMHEVAFRLSDVAGESYAFEELVLAQVRNMRQPRLEEQPVWHAADCMGDCGAAAGLVQFAWAEQAFKRGYAPGELAALHGSSMAFGGRAAALVST
jgi:3-oxoacyl-[acyl-carrier-protein] synthase-1